MRTRFSQITTIVAVFFTIAAISLTGCQSGFKMPSIPSIGSWGKKKPTSLATKPATELPSPNATANPGQLPSYAKGRGTGATGMGARPGGSHYLNASHGTAPSNPGYAHSGASPARGFYSPEYGDAGARQSVSGGYDRPTTSYPSNPGSSGSGSRNDSYGAGGFPPRSGAPATGQAWTSEDRGSQYGGTSPRSTVSDYGYGRTATRNSASASDYRSHGAPGSASDYSRASASVGGTSPSYLNSKSGPPYRGAGSPAAGSVPPPTSPSVASGDYLPGSTGRRTQYGDSQDINVAGLRDIQPASYGADNGVSDTRSVRGGSQAPSTTYGPEESRTATGLYPETNSSIYNR